MVEVESRNDPALHAHLARAMAPGAGPDVVMAELFGAAHAWILAGEGAIEPLEPPPADGSLGARLARHAAVMLRNGATLPAALDDALVLLLYAGEAEALRHGPSADADPVGARPLARQFRDYAERLTADRPARSPSLRNRSRNVQLMITRRCQLRCAYCPVVKADRDMPREVIEAAVDLLLTREPADVRLDFTGGEPLLRLDEVRRAACRLLEGVSARGGRAGFYMVTNGFLLTPAVARQLADLGFRVELSLDGEEADHNRHKIPVDMGENPYLRTRRALDAALEAGLEHTVVMVATPDTVDRLRPSFEHAVACGARRIDVNYAIGRAWCGPALDRFCQVLEGIVRDHAPRLAEGRLALGNLGSRVEPAVLNGEWMVDTDGSLHLMTEWSLESSRPADSPDLGRGSLRSVSAWDDLYAGRFHAYETLLRTHGWRDGRLRLLLHDNITAGRWVGQRLAGIGAAGR